GLLRQVTQAQARPAIDGLGRDLAPIEEDAALVRAQEPHDHVERRALAGAVRPQESHDLAAPHVQRHALHHAPLAVVADESLGREARELHGALDRGVGEHFGHRWAPGSGDGTWVALGSTVARIWRSNSKCSRFGSLSKPMPSSTVPSFSTRTSLSDVMRRRLLK